MKKTTKIKSKLLIDFSEMNIDFLGGCTMKNFILDNPDRFVLLQGKATKGKGCVTYLLTYLEAYIYYKIQSVKYKCSIYSDEYVVEYGKEKDSWVVVMENMDSSQYES